MRIIDSNVDFYDFYQNIYRDDLYTFDRRDSYDLSKEVFMGRFDYTPLWHFSSRVAEDNNRTRFLLLQVCNTFWLIKMYITKVDEGFYHQIKDYNLTLIHTWKDYSLKREKLKLSEISFHPYINDTGYHAPKASSVEDMMQSIHINEYKTVQTFNRFIKRDLLKGQFVEKKFHIPILQNIGFAAIIEPIDIYMSLEEYCAAEIRDKERTESIGLTDKEKIESHGFDTKISFRGK